MKCIRKQEDGEDRVMRLPDDEAKLSVEACGWHYCPKSVWKAAGRP
jgi:phage pi2 protein 07